MKALVKLTIVSLSVIWLAACGGDVLKNPDPNPDYETFGDRYIEVKARREGLMIAPQALWQAMQKPLPWQALNGPTAAMNLTDEEKTDGREFIKLNPLKIESLVAGDSFEFSLGQLNRHYVARVTDVRSEDNGLNVTWTASLDGLEETNHLTLTKGESLIIGGITVPEGLFQIHVMGEVGWIVNSSTLFKGQDQQVMVPPELINNPPPGLIFLPPETFGEQH